MALTHAVGAGLTCGRPKRWNATARRWSERPSTAWLSITPKSPSCCYGVRWRSMQRRKSGPCWGLWQRHHDGLGLATMAQPRVSCLQQVNDRSYSMGITRRANRERPLSICGRRSGRGRSMAGVGNEERFRPRRL